MKHRILLISIWMLTVWNYSIDGWHTTLTFTHQLTYNSSQSISFLASEMKFFMWYDSYAIYGAREKLILLKPVLNTSSVHVFSYNWSVDPLTMDECLQEWNTKEKCYNDIVHVRILPNSSLMDVYCTYAHRPMVRSFDLQSMSFIDDDILTRDPHPPMDSERSYVMLTFNTSIVTAGYQGDYIPTIRGTQGKTLLYALRQNSYFIGGFKYDGKAVFGVIESNRVSRLVMTCANRAEIIRKATLNCSTDMFDQSRSFVFHILTHLIEPIHTSNGSVLLFATFTTNNSSITASAVCLFLLDRQFYDVFTSPSIKKNRANDLNELIYNCSPAIPSTIDRDMVESEKQFLPYQSNPLLIETMSTHTFTAIDVIQYQSDVYCLIIGTSDGRVLTAFTDRSFQTSVFEELRPPMHQQSTIKSITHREVISDNTSYVIIVTHQLGYLTVKLTTCQTTKLCFQCWLKDCSIQKHILSSHRCSSTNTIRLNSSLTNHSNRNRSLLAIVIVISFVVFILLTCIIILLFKFTHKIKHGRFYPIHSRKTQDLSTAHTYTNNIMYRTNNNKLLIERKNQQHVFPIASDLGVRRIASNPVYTTVSSQSLPSLIASTPIVRRF